ncbi:MAG: dcm [Solirubrobacterales bacterium]|nr:dcm [Solirubrobacterales bacterium]
MVIGIDRELGVEPTLPPASHLGSAEVFAYGLGDLVTPTAANLAKTLGASPQIGARHEERYDPADGLPPRPDLLRNLITVWDAIGDLPSLDPGRGVPVATPSEYAIALGAGERDPANHEAWGHAEETVARLASIPEGDRLKTERRYYSQAYARLHRRGLSRTITTNFHNAGCGRFTHPLESRTITVREAARLQGIEDDFSFVGHGALQERLVGNAFPLPLAESIGRHLASQLDSVGALD